MIRRVDWETTRAGHLAVDSHRHRDVQHYGARGIAENPGRGAVAAAERRHDLAAGQNAGVGVDHIPLLLGRHVVASQALSGPLFLRCAATVREDLAAVAAYAGART